MRTRSVNVVTSKLLVLLSAALVCCSGLARQPQVMPDSWIVVLDDAPTLEYRGADPAIATAKGGLEIPSLAATAPAVTGQARFDAHAPQVTQYVKYLDRQRQATLASASTLLARDIEPTAVFRHALNGFSVRMSEAEAARLEKLPGIQAVIPDYIHQMELAYGPELIGARALAAGEAGVAAAPGTGVVVGIIDSGINWDHLAFSDNSGSHTFTNPYGSGRGLCSNSQVGCNNKLVGVYDFTTEGSQGKDTVGHGTHVASTAAGVAWQNNHAGVAPGANIISYKVCYESLPDDPDSSGCSSSAISQSLDQAIADGVDVVNFSIGSTNGPSPWIQFYGRQVLNVRDAGITFVTSAGNDGPLLETISYPADAPWVLAVGSSTHKLRSGHRIIMNQGAWFVVYGGGPPPPSPPINGAPFIPGNEAGGTMLGCSAFPSNAFSNSVALFTRGECDFADKVDHAASAGARAVIVINNVPGDPIVMGGLEGTAIPAGMISLGDGEAVLGLMDAASQTLNVSLPTSMVNSENIAWQDRMSSFSARGPSVHARDLVKPNLVAPGQSIRAATLPGTVSAGLASGTSMASPHVAGAVAQLRQLHPNWSPAVLQSVLETTAETDPLTDVGEPASIFDRGNGRIRVDRAARAGLYLPVTRAQFVEADPAIGGDPGKLNFAGILVGECGGSCTVTRTVEALVSGSWTVETVGDLDISVTPSTFSLQAGQQQTLTIDLAATSGTTNEGRVLLNPTSTNLVQQALTVAAFQDGSGMPARKEIAAQANRGSDELNIGFAPALPEAVFNTSALIEPHRETFELAQDPSNNNPFTGDAGTRTFLVDVPEDTLLLFAEVLSSQSPDIDLFVGRDDNGNGEADESELVCFSTTPSSLEECAIESPQPGKWWILVQNWQASSANAEDEVELEYAVLTAAPSESSLIASSVGNHPGGSLKVNLYWDQPAMRENERWIGAMGVSSTPDALADAGVVPIMVSRTTPNEPQATALFSGQSLAVVLPPNTIHDRLFIDVPASANRLDIHVEGDPGVNAAVQLTGLDELAGWAPGTPPPSSDQLTSGNDSAAGISLSVGSAGNALESARYYVVLENTSSEERRVHVQADLIESTGMTPRFGLWSPKSRSIFQGFDWQLGGDAALVWYTYGEDGLPAYYIATGNLDTNSSVWRAPLYRVTSNRQRQAVDTVGQVTLTSINPGETVFAWRLNGAHGSEIMTPDAAQTCPEVNGSPASYTGLWFHPNQTLGGTSVTVTDYVKVFVRYFFDDDGVGRWVIASGELSDDTMEVLEFRGFCPNCPEESMSVEDNSSSVGFYGVVFDSETAATEVIDFTLDEPLNHHISIDVPIEKLSFDLSCQ